MLFHPCGWVGAEVLTCSLTTGLGRDRAVRIKRGLDSNGGEKEKKRKGEIKRETVRGGLWGLAQLLFPARSADWGWFQDSLSFSRNTTTRPKEETGGNQHYEFLACYIPGGVDDINDRYKGFFVCLFLLDEIWGKSGKIKYGQCDNYEHFKSRHPYLSNLYNPYHSVLEVMEV